MARIPFEGNFLTLGKFGEIHKFSIGEISHFPIRELHHFLMWEFLIEEFPYLPEWGAYPLTILGNSSKMWLFMFFLRLHITSLIMIYRLIFITTFHEV